MSARHGTKLLPLLTWRGAICKSNLPPTTRHVALTLSLYMSEIGDSAHPGPTRLANETGLCLRAVKTALSNLVAEGWLVVVEQGGLRGERRRANEYRAHIPDPALPLDEPRTTRAGDAPVQEMHPCTESTRASSSTTRAGDAGVPVQQVHPISSSNSPMNSPITPPTPSRPPAKKNKTPEPTPEFLAFWDVYPRRVGKDPALRAWATAISRAPAEAIIWGAESYARSCESNGTESQYIKHPGPWLNDSRWTDEPEQDSNLTMLARLVAEARSQPKELDA